MKPRNAIVSLAIRTDAKKASLENKQLWEVAMNYMLGGEHILTEKPKITIVQDTPKSKKKGVK